MESTKPHPRPRIGKTTKDRASGASQRNHENKLARMEFDQQTSQHPVSFPVHACNGQKNRSRFTGKGNKTIIRGA